MILIFLQVQLYFWKSNISLMLPYSSNPLLIQSLFVSQVVIYGDGTSTPLTLRDWTLVDYDHIWQQVTSYSIPHCIAETYQQLMQRVKE